ncbi:MAG: chemotaxis protein CheA [Nitrospirae bacterium]|nr:chemotaxis protein CheA [Nitrospirota bacterium]MCL5237717.1 chemotaxis protein CheA [Nitrospirota bacterium]
MSGAADKHRETFREEANELLTELETALLELEETPDDTELIGRVFRAMHTIKGSGAMFGFDDIAAFTHEVETAFDLVRNGKTAVTKGLIDLTLSARDQIRAMLNPSDTETVDVVKAGELVAAFRELVTGKKKDACPSAPASGKGSPSAQVSAGVKSEKATYRVRFHPARDIFMCGTNPLCLLNEMRGLGNCRIVAQLEAVPPLEDLNPGECYTYWDIILTTDQGINAIKDVFIFVEDSSDLKIDVIDDGGRLDTESDYKRLGEILTERGDLTTDDLQKTLSAQKRIGELLIETGTIEPGHVESALAEQKHVKEIRKERQSTESISSIRVPSEKLDKLVDLVGELVTVQARLSQTAAAGNDSTLLSISEEIERLTWELRDNTMNIRMIPIGTTFSKFKRLVRDLSGELGKEIEMTTDGAETELDKTVIEKLNDPLVHLIRNSIDHGIEMPGEREAAGKPKQGTVHLSAVHSGTSVLIRIKDDGKGLDAETIRAKAAERGLIASDAELSDRELFELILLPGFSTAKNITNVSGRGVGMDVVKQALGALRGHIEIASTKGEGTTITLRLPLTLAIIEGLLVKIADDCFVFPLSVVEECVELTRKDVTDSHGRNLANVRGQIIPYIRLRERFAIGGDLPEIEQIVIIGSDGCRTGFVVDNVIGEHQTVIKSLGRFYRDTEGLSGATILGDGTVALILDINKLVRNAELDEQAAL